MTTNTQSKILKDKEEAPFIPADKHISSQDKQVFQTTENTSASAETRLIYVALSAPTSPVLGQQEFLQGTLSSWQVALKMVRRSRGLASQALTAWKIFTVTRRRLTLVLHAIHLAQSHSHLIVKCDNTDVLVLLLYYSSKGMFGSSAVFMHSWHGLKERFVPICLIAQKLGAVLCECLPACHALTGCDTTSSLYRIGKATALTRLKTHLCELQEITKFGLSGSLEEA